MARLSHKDSGLGTERGDGSDILEREQRLFQAVICRALLDAEIIPMADLVAIGFKSGRDNSSWSADRREVLRDSARRWLTIEFGDWCEDRTLTCDLAGVDEPALRKVCRRRLDIINGKISAGENVLPFDVRLTRFIAAMVEAGDGVIEEDDVDQDQEAA